MSNVIPAFKNYLAGQNLIFDQAESDRQADIQNQRANQRIDQVFEQAQQANANRANAEYQERIRSRQLNKYHEQDTEKLYFKEDENTTVKPLQENRAEFGAMQVNKANKLKIALDASEITFQDYTKGMSMLETQLGMFKAAEQAILTGGEKYLAALDSDKLSNANKGYYEEFWGSVADGSADITWDTDKNGQIVMSGTFPTENGKEKVRIPLSEIDKMPSVLMKPDESSIDFMEQDIETVYEARRMRAIEMNGPEGQFQVGSAINQESKTPESWAEDKFGTAFDQYIGALGEGDVVKELQQYVMDDQFGSFAFNQIVTDYDPSKETKAEYIERAGKDRGLLTNLKNAFKKDWISKSSYFYDEAQREALETINKTKDGNKSGSGSDQPEEDFVVQQAKKILGSSNKGERSLIRTDGERTVDYFDFKDVEGMEITPKYKEERDKGSTVGGTKQVEVPGQFVLSTPGGKSINISQSELNDPKKYMRKYFASMNIPTKPTQNNPKTIDWYMNEIFKFVPPHKR
jgi:hypothetical protein